MALKLINSETLSAIANAIRSKKGDTAPIVVENMATEIENLPSGGEITELTSISQGTTSLTYSIQQPPKFIFLTYVFASLGNYWTYVPRIVDVVYQLDETTGNYTKLSENSSYNNKGIYRTNTVTVTISDGQLKFTSNYFGNPSSTVGNKYRCWVMY